MFNIYNSHGKVLIALSKYPTEGVTLRKLSKISGVSLGLLSKIIKRLEKKGIVKKQKVGRSYLITLNIEDETVRNLRKVINISLIYLSGIVEEIRKYFPTAIILFGSFTEGNDTESSDIDMVVFGVKEVKIDTKKYMEMFNRRINIFCFEDISKVGRNLLNYKWSNFVWFHRVVK